MPVSPEQMPNTDDYVALKSDDLIVGRKLNFPLYGDDGLLILAEGMTITPEFRKKILERNISELKVHRDEVANISCAEPSDAASFIEADQAIAKQLDEIIDSGFLNVVNSEAAVAEQVVQHGTANYNVQKHQERIQRNQESSAFVGDLMKNALHGKNVDFAQVTRLTADYMSDMTGDMDSNIVSMVDSVRQDEISDHCVKMSLLGMALGVEMRLDGPNVRNIGLAGLVHDWGMVRVPDEVRHAKRWLTDHERFHITKHPSYTLRLLERLPGIPSLAMLVVYQVHECPNGKGYPQGRTRERIHLMARILSVADRYDALVSPRPYRPALTPYSAMECLLRQSASGDVDPEVVRALLMLQSLFPIGSYVSLSDGSVARVLRRNGEKFNQPIVRIVRDENGKEYSGHDQGTILDLSVGGMNVVRSLPTPGSNAVNLSPEILQMTDTPEAMDASLQGALGSCLAPRKRAIRSSADPVISLEDYTEPEKRRSQEALHILESAAARDHRAGRSKRAENSVSLRTVVSISLTDLDNSVIDIKSSRLLKAMTWDVSGSGVSFVCPRALSQNRLLIGLHLNPQTTRWFIGEVQRTREVAHTGFWEHVVAFRQSVVV
jgi:HD-GYP domain-containing protein (c-di-GMP phosphodiesterase class II)